MYRRVCAAKALYAIKSVPTVKAFVFVFPQVLSMIINRLNPQVFLSFYRSLCILIDAFL